MLRFLWIVQHGSSLFSSIHSKGVVHLYSSFYIVHPHSSPHSSPTHKRIPQKPVNSFLFVFSRWCKNSSRTKKRA